MMRDIVSPKLDQASIFTLMGNSEASLKVISEVEKILEAVPNEEMLPYVKETIGSSFLYSGNLDLAHLNYSDACKMADSQGLGGVYFNAPRNYVKFLLMCNEKAHILMIG